MLSFLLLFKLFVGVKIIMTKPDPFKKLISWKVTVLFVKKKPLS